jgi:hypothetical protein
MSTQGVCKTTINDKEMLIECVKEIMGANSVDVVEGGVDVRGYATGRRPTVVLRIPGLYGTAGFAVGADGNYELVYDSMDKRKLDKLLPKKKGEVTHNKLAQIYSRLKAQKMMKSLKGKLVSNKVDSDGRIKLRIRTVQYG